MGVAGPVVGRGGQDRLIGQRLGDQEQAHPAEEQGEDPFDDGCGHRIEFQDVVPPAVGGFGGVGMRAGVGEAVAVGGRPPR